VFVTVPPGLVGALRLDRVPHGLERRAWQGAFEPTAFESVAEVEVRVVPVAGSSLAAQVRAVLEAEFSAPRGPSLMAEPIVVVHDPLHPLAPPNLVRAVIDALDDAVDGVVAAVPLGPVTDTLKWVDGDDVVTATADRQAFRVVQSPQAFRAARFALALAKADPSLVRVSGAEVLARVVEAAGGRLRAVVGAAEAFRVADPEDLVFAEVVQGALAAR
jgi:2-C-methyl-D-erythritol 4-phosphate cytidylyltransferase